MLTSPRRYGLAAAAATASAALVLTAPAASAGAATAGGLPGPTAFTYTGAGQSYRVPAGVVLVRVDAVGAFGGPTCGGDVFACTGTVPNGQPINTATTGKHTFTVRGSVGGATAAGTVTYTVR